MQRSPSYSPGSTILMSDFLSTKGLQYQTACTLFLVTKLGRGCALWSAKYNPV